jgi:hypothetical protein
MSTMKELCRTTPKTTIKCNVNPNGLPDDWEDPHAHAYLVTLRRKGRRLTVPFYTGSAWDHDPEAHDVLECLCSDAMSVDQDFENWCADLGFDSDSRKDERTYKACVKIAEKLRRFLGEDFEMFCRAGE